MHAHLEPFPRPCRQPPSPPGPPPRRRLLLRKALWSEKAARLQLTVVTGLTSSRLDQLEAQCASWKGPLSAAVYLVLRGDGAGGMGEEARQMLEQAEANVTEFHKK